MSIREFKAAEAIVANMIACVNIMIMNQDGGGVEHLEEEMQMFQLFLRRFVAACNYLLTEGPHVELAEN